VSTSSIFLTQSAAAIYPRAAAAAAAIALKFYPRHEKRKQEP